MPLKLNSSNHPSQPNRFGLRQHLQIPSRKIPRRLRPLATTHWRTHQHSGTQNGTHPRTHPRRFSRLPPNRSPNPPSGIWNQTLLRPANRLQDARLLRQAETAILLWHQSSRNFFAANSLRTSFCIRVHRREHPTRLSSYSPVGTRPRFTALRPRPTPAGDTISNQLPANFVRANRYSDCYNRRT